MIHIDLIVQSLRNHGRRVEHVTRTPENAGDYELTIDGEVLNLEGARALLEADETQ